MSSERPDRTTMEGMIWNANHVLATALDPKTVGIPKALFKEAYGIILLSTIEAGFIFSGNVGTGIILARAVDGTWSPPCACGLTGVGWGLLVGGAVRDIIVFILDDSALDAVTSDNGLKIGAQLSLTVGTFGRDYAGDLHVSGRGMGATVTVAMSKGVFGGISVEGAVVGARHAVNETYYNKPSISPRQILMDKAVQPRENSLMPEIYKKLDLLAEGATAQPDEAERAKVGAARQEAEQAGEAARQADDVEYVDATAKAAQEEEANVVQQE